MSERYYVACPLEPGPVDLSGPEAHHLAHVCRLRAGDELRLFNGDGREYLARVNDVARRAVTLEVLSASEPQRELPFRLEIAASIPKGDRGQFLIEKLTELGVTTFIPLACQRSLVLPREVRRDKLERYVIEASKQCGRNVLMEIGALSDWASYCAQDQTGMLAILAHPEPTESAQPRSLAHLVGTAKRAQAGLALRFAIGPEGGFSEGEIERARAAGWHLLDLGPRILRIETAALAVALLGTQWRAESEPDA